MRQKLPNKELILNGVKLALNQLDDMRKAEGEKILEDILKRVKRIQKIVDLIKEKANNINLSNRKD